MQSDTLTAQSIFEGRRQYKVPFYQRAYVWTKGDQWEQLWEDIQEKADERHDGEPTTPHFMGAIVLAPENRSGFMGVESYLIIDGQQRLTTYTLILKAFKLALNELCETAVSNQIGQVMDSLLWNPNQSTMRSPETEIFKLWPTFKTRGPYVSVTQAESRSELRRIFPENFTSYDTLRKNRINHPLPLEAAWHFCDKIIEYCTAETADETSTRLTHLAEAILTDFKFVVITLEENDDPQVIFETLNGRGARLHATDLIRNHLFLLADRQNADSETLFETFWKPFETEDWSAIESRGRLKRPRLEWFMHAFLQSRLGKEVDLSRVFAVYKSEYSARVCMQASDQSKELHDASSLYQHLVDLDESTPLGRFGKRMLAFDASTTHSLALYLATTMQGKPKGVLDEQLGLIVSYVVRRAVCGLTAKSYNKTFVAILRKLARQDGQSPSLRAILEQMDGKAVRWPDDAEFTNALINADLYHGRLDAGRTRSLLAEIELTLRRTTRVDDHFNEHFGHLDVEHIMPNAWHKHWPLPGAPSDYHPDIDLYLQMEASGQELGPLEAAALNRHRKIRTLGNLTLLNLSVNREAQNKEFSVKKDLLIRNTNLRLNIPLLQIDAWDEMQIEKRSQDLAAAAVLAWPGPSKSG